MDCWAVRSAGSIRVQGPVRLLHLVVGDGAGVASRIAGSLSLYLIRLDWGLMKPSSLAFMMACSARSSGRVDLSHSAAGARRGCAAASIRSREGVAAEIGVAPALVEDLLVAEVVEELDEPLAGLAGRFQQGGAGLVGAALLLAAVAQGAQLPKKPALPSSTAPRPARRPGRPGRRGPWSGSSA
jgi:hypothetical protein